ncbi:MAG: penicillin acylase family protein [Alphaproteobacteria bacterium]|nr:penicillin acylase family protein [Alphaproteobacteria bacterium]
MSSEVSLKTAGGGRVEARRGAVWRRLLLWFGVLALAVVAGALGVFGWSYWGSVPDYDGDARLAGLESEARLVRGADGQLLVEAESLTDAVRAVGFAHAQERMEQMDILRRIGRGRLSELMGSRTVPIDRFMRTLNLDEHLSSDFAALDSRTREILEAYAEGVNGYLAHHGDGVWSPLLQFTGATPPEPWRVEDSLLWGKVTALRLARNWQNEERNLELRNILGESWEVLYPIEPARIRAVGDINFNGDSDGAAVNVNVNDDRDDNEGAVNVNVNVDDNGDNDGAVNVNVNDDNDGDTVIVPDDDKNGGAVNVDVNDDKNGAVNVPDDENGGGVNVGGGGGSNFWAVAPRRTPDGATLFASDPHLDLTLPPVWYLVRIETPEITLAGAIPPGLPLPLIGHSNHHAWGLTNHFGDTQDLLVETLSADGARYITADGEQEFNERREVIHVRGGEPVTFTARDGRHGPVISDLPGSRTERLAAPGTALTLAWPALAAGDTTASAAVGFALARDIDDFRRAAADFIAPVQNLGYADSQGNIAIFTIGRLPKRAGAGGDLPAKAGPSAWREGMIPFAELPSFINPPSGLVTNSNDRLTDDTYPYFTGEDWLPPSRAERLRAVLDAHDTIGMDEMRAAQLDLVSRGAQKFLPFLLSQVNDDGDDTAARALAMLREWDGAMNAELTEPLLYHLWFLALEESLLLMRLDEELLPATYGKGWNRARVRRLLDSEWCEEDRCRDIVNASFQTALARLAEIGNGDPFAAEWGDLHRAHIGHPILGFNFPFNPWRRELPTGGADDTVNLALPETKDGSLHHTIGAGLRFIVNLDAPDESLFMINGGQSGHPASPFYDNLLERWLRGGYIRLSLDDEARGRARIFRLTP